MRAWTGLSTELLPVFTPTAESHPLFPNLNQSAHGEQAHVTMASFQALA